MGLFDGVQQMAMLVALVVVALALRPLVQSAGGDVSFSAQAIIVVTALLGSVVTGLGIMFKAYQGAVAARIADLQGQLIAKDKDIEYWRSLSEQGTRLAETATAAYRGREYSNRPPESRGHPHA